MLLNIPEKGVKLECLSDSEGLTVGKVYEVDYCGGDHAVINNDKGERTVLVKGGSGRYVDLYDFKKAVDARDTNVYKLFNTKLPAIDYLDEGGLIDSVDYYVDIAEGMRLVFCYETTSLLINDVEVGEINEEVAGELLGLVQALGYTESHS